MAYGLEARVPFLDKKFLEVAMNIDAKEKMFNKGSAQETDADGKPRIEKVSSRRTVQSTIAKTSFYNSTSSERHSMYRQMDDHTCPTRFSGDKRNNSRTVLVTAGSTVSKHTPNEPYPTPTSPRLPSDSLTIPLPPRKHTTSEKSLSDTSRVRVPLAPSCDGSPRLNGTALKILPDERRVSITLPTTTRTRLEAFNSRLRHIIYPQSALHGYCIFG
jgi:hypothetical protein